MSTSRLARMANQIAASVPDQSQATAQTAAHLQAFWTPAMIDALLLESAADPGLLSEPARDALDLLVRERTP